MTLPTPYYDEDGITLYCGDCRDVIPALEPVDLVVTDPPYGIGWSRSANAARSSKAHAGIANDQDTTARDAALGLLADVPAAVFGSFYAPFPVGVKQVLVWSKPADAGVVGSTTGFRRDAEPVFLVGPWPQRTVRWSSVLEPGARSIAAVATAAGHPHAKPIALLRDLIERAAGGGIVLDPFAGSGSTLVAARQLGRRAIGIELDAGYCEKAVARLAQGSLDFEAAA